MSPRQREGLALKPVAIYPCQECTPAPRAVPATAALIDAEWRRAKAESAGGATARPRSASLALKQISPYRSARAVSRYNAGALHPRPAPDTRPRKALGWKTAAQASSKLLQSDHSVTLATGS